MKEKLRFLGLDVHAETIAVAIAEPDGEVRSLGTIPNRGESIRKMIKKLGAAEKSRERKWHMAARPVLWRDHP
jgi:transposase